MFTTSLVFLLFLTLLGNTAAVMTVTLFNVEEDDPASTATGDGLSNAESYFPTPTHIYSAIAVGADGLTTYVEEIVASEDVAVSQSPSQVTSGGSIILTGVVVSVTTIPYPNPSTYYFTLAEGESQYSYVLGTPNGPPQKSVSCHWNVKNGQGICQIVDADGTLTDAYTYSGTIAPIQTLVVSNIHGQTNAGSTIEAARPSVIGVSMYAALLVFTVLFMIYGTL